MFSQYLRAAARRCRLPLAGVGVAAYLSSEKELHPQTTLLIEFDKIKITDRKRSASDQLDDYTIETRELVEALEQAAADDKIRQVVATTGNGSNVDQYGAADVEEIRRAVKSFGKAKQATVYQENIPSIQACFFSSAFPTRILHPRGDMCIAGLSTDVYFAGSMLKRHGVRVDVFRHGRFKSAPSFWSSTGLTKSERENLTSVQNCTLRTLWLGILAENQVLISRILPFIDYTRFVEWAEQNDDVFREISGYTSAEGAGEYGFIHGVGEITIDPKQFGDAVTLPDYIERQKNAKARKERWDLLCRFSSLFVLATSQQARFQAYNDSVDLGVDPSFCFTSNLYTSLLQETPKIPVIYVSGEIGPQSAKNVVASLRQIQREIEMGANIKQVVIRVSSPGGDTVSSSLISDQLDALSVPVVVSFGNVAASGGFWIAAKADRIFTNRTTRTGSIGAYVLRFDLSKAFKQSGLNVEHISTGPLADLHNPLHPITPAVKEALSSKSTAIYDQFKERVAHGRNMSKDQVENLAQGRVYTGKQAQANGLVDEIGGLNEAIDYVRHKHGMDNAVVEVYPAQQPFDFSDLVMHMLLGDKVSSSVVETVGQIESLVRLLGSKARAGQISDKTMLVADEKTAVEMALKQLGLEDSK